MTDDWKALSDAVSREQNPEKLLELVELLNKALEERENARKHEKHPPKDKDKDEKSNLIPFDEGGDQWFLIA